MEILAEARALGGLGPFLFPGVRGQPVGSTAMAELLRRLRIAAVPRGFRSSFRDWADYLAGESRDPAAGLLRSYVTWGSTRFMGR